MACRASTAPDRASAAISSTSSPSAAAPLSAAVAVADGPARDRVLQSVPCDLHQVEPALRRHPRPAMLRRPIGKKGGSHARSERDPDRPTVAARRPSHPLTQRESLGVVDEVDVGRTAHDRATHDIAQVDPPQATQLAHAAEVSDTAGVVEGTGDSDAARVAVVVAQAPDGGRHGGNERGCRRGCVQLTSRDSAADDAPLVGVHHGHGQVRTTDLEHRNHPRDHHRTRDLTRRTRSAPSRRSR